VGVVFICGRGLRRSRRSCILVVRRVVLGVVPAQIVRGGGNALCLIAHEWLHLLVPLIIVIAVPVFGNVGVGCEHEEPEEEGDDHQDAGRREGHQAWDQQPLHVEIDAEDGEENDSRGPQHKNLQHGEDQPGKQQASNPTTGSDEEKEVEKDVEASGTGGHQGCQSSIFADCIEEIPELCEGVLGQPLLLVLLLQHSVKIFEEGKQLRVVTSGEKNVGRWGNHCRGDQDPKDGNHSGCTHNTTATTHPECLAVYFSLVSLTCSTREGGGVCIC